MANSASRTGGAAAPVSETVAEFRHRGRAWAAATLPLIALQVAIGRSPGGPRIVAIFVAAVLGYAFLLCWRGFRYRIERDGLRLLGLVRSIAFHPWDTVVSCAADRCNPLSEFGGWGVRGSRCQRGLILGGGRGVRIKLTDGELFLGTHEAEALCAAIASASRRSRSGP